MSIQQWEDRSAVALSNTQDIAIHRLSEWAQSADAAYAVAERLSSSAFVPAQFKNKPVELTAAILSGLEVGLSPMAAMRSFDIIQGQAAPKAITLRAIAQSHGHELVLVESTSARCKMKGRRKGSDEWQPVTWTLDRARDLQLLGKDNWKKQPGAMLLARATSELARLIASDAILGIGYSSEELADGGSYDQQVDEVTSTPSAPEGTRKMSRPAPTVSGPEVSNEGGSSGSVAVGSDVGDPGPESPSDAPMVTKAQLTKIGAAMGDLGIKARDEALGYVAVAIGREVGSRNELTREEASDLIEKLEGDIALAGTQDADEVKS